MNLVAGFSTVPGNRAPGRNTPSRANQILGLDLASAHLALLRALADLGDERLLLFLELNPLLVQLSDRLVEEPLVLAQTLRRRHALAESPFQDLPPSVSAFRLQCRDGGMLTFMLKSGNPGVGFETESGHGQRREGKENQSSGRVWRLNESCAAPDGAFVRVQGSA